ncbi:4474_t:CDS:2, partial [Scutellospora calospora]
AQYYRQLLQFKLDQFNTTYNTDVLAKKIDILKTEILKSSKFEELLVLSILSTLSSNSTITNDFNITLQNKEEKTIQNLIN